MFRHLHAYDVYIFITLSVPTWLDVIQSPISPTKFDWLDQFHNFILYFSLLVLPNSVGL